MLYSNRNYKAEEREFEWGKLWQIAAGEFGRGRRAIVLTCPTELEIKEGMNDNISVGQTKSLRPKLINRDDQQLFMLISSAGGYTRRGSGRIYVPKAQSQNVEVIERGNGADGAAGRIGSWDVLLMHVKGDVVIRNRTSGSGYGTPTDYYVVKENRVFHCEGEHQLSVCLDEKGIEPQFQLSHSEDGISIETDDWNIL